jgi:hypothetical protein
MLGMQWWLDYEEAYPIFLISAFLLDFEGIERHVLNKSGGGGGPPISPRGYAPAPAVF